MRKATYTIAALLAVLIGCVSLHRVPSQVSISPPPEYFDVGLSALDFYDEATSTGLRMQWSQSESALIFWELGPGRVKGNQRYVAFRDTDGVLTMRPGDVDIIPESTTDLGEPGVIFDAGHFEHIATSAIDSLDPESEPVIVGAKFLGVDALRSDGSVFADSFVVESSGASILSGHGSPEGVVPGRQGSLFLSTGPTTGTLYIKTLGGSGSTGWIAATP